MTGSFVDTFEDPVILDGPDDYSWHEFTDTKKVHGFDKYYAFDDDFVRNDPWQKEGKRCRRTSWHKLYHPNCNQFHETEVMSRFNKYLGSGYYRDVFLVRNNPDDPDLVYKLNRIPENPFAYDRYEFIRMDALIMERLTSSPRIPDIHGHCGTSMLTEYLNREIETEMIPGSGKHYKKDLKNSKEVR